MSVCTFIASDSPLSEVAPSKKYPVHIDIDNGTMDDGGADDNFFLFSFRDVQDYTDKKYGVYLKWFEWGEIYCGHEPYPYRVSRFPEPHFDLEFWVRLPKAYKY